MQLAIMSPGGLSNLSDDNRAYVHAPARSQTWSAEGYDRHARFVSNLGGDVLALLAPKPGERILDLGCGDGQLTEEIANSGADVLGIDLSENLLDVARAKGLNVQALDGHELSFDGEFDAVFSNAALHWMTDPKRVIEGIYRSLKPGGRFAAEFGGHGNVAAIITAMRAVGKQYGGDIDLAGPWFFPTSDEYRGLLESVGFIVDKIGLFPRPTPLPTGIEGWLQTFRKPFFDQFPEPQRGKVIEGVADLLRPSLCDNTGQWTADYVRLRVLARIDPVHNS